MAKKPMFALGAFDDLRAASGETTGAPLMIAVNLIDEDPDQPRTTFDQAELEALADSIRLRGVLQPIGVLPAENGRHLLRWGARRLRASILAGEADIPAIIVPARQRDLTTQVIENQQRAGLSNSDLAAVVEKLSTVDGLTIREVSVVCNIPRHTVSYYRAMSTLPAFLATRLNNADVRAIYELLNAWKNNGSAIEAAVASVDGYLSVTEARRIVQGATGKAVNSVFLRDKGSTPEAPSTPLPSPEPDLPTGREDREVPPSPPRPVLSGRDAPGSPVEPEGRGTVKAPPLPKDTIAPGKMDAPVRAVTPPAPVEDAPQGLPVFVMETADGQQGVLVTDRRATTKGHVLLSVGGVETEVAFAGLRAVTAN